MAAAAAAYVNSKKQPLTLGSGPGPRCPLACASHPPPPGDASHNPKPTGRSPNGSLLWHKSILTSSHGKHKANSQCDLGKGIWLSQSQDSCYKHRAGQQSSLLLAFMCCGVGNGVQGSLEGGRVHFYLFFHFLYGYVCGVLCLCMCACTCGPLLGCLYMGWPQVDVRIIPHGSTTLFTEARSPNQSQSSTIWLL